MTVRRPRVNISTDAIRSKKSYSKGIHIFKLKWDQLERGSHSCIGVMNEHGTFRHDGYYQISINTVLNILILVIQHCLVQTVIHLDGN